MTPRRASVWIRPTGAGRRMKKLEQEEKRFMNTKMALWISGIACV